MSKPQPPKPSPSEPAVSGRFFRFFRGKGDYAPYIGLESVTLEGGKVVRIMEEKFTSLPNITEGIALDAMHGDTKK